MSRQAYFNEKKKKFEGNACFDCGRNEYDNDFTEYKISLSLDDNPVEETEDMIETIWLCDICRDNMIDFLREDLWFPPKRSWFARPISKKSTGEKMYFETAEEFEEWCEIEQDLINDMGYIFGITKERQLTYEELDKWRKTNRLPDDVSIFWTIGERNYFNIDDPDTDSEDHAEKWKDLLDMYKEGDCEFSSIDSDGAILKIDMNKYMDAIEKRVNSDIERKNKVLKNMLRVRELLNEKDEN